MSPPGRLFGHQARVLFLPLSLAAALEHLARAALPDEACAALLGRRLAHGFRLQAVRAGRNLHPRPRSAFELDPGAVVAAQVDARDLGLELVGFFHSHPAGEPAASAADRRADWEGHLGLILGLDAEGRARMRAYRMARAGWRPLAIARLPS